MLKNKSELNKFCIGSNDIGVEGRSREEAVVGNDGGRECYSKWMLTASLFPYHLAGAIALAGSLRGKSQLKKLTFENNGIEDEGALTLAHAVSSSPRLSTFVLSGNPITPDVVAQIRKLVPVVTFVANVSVVFVDGWCY